MKNNHLHNVKVMNIKTSHYAPSCGQWLSLHFVLNSPVSIQQMFKECSTTCNVGWDEMVFHKMCVAIIFYNNLPFFIWTTWSGVGTSLTFAAIVQSRSQLLKILRRWARTQVNMTLALPKFVYIRFALLSSMLPCIQKKVFF